MSGSTDFGSILQMILTIVVIVVGLLVVLYAVLSLRKALKKRGRKNIGFCIGKSAVTAVFLVVVIVLNMVIGNYGSIVTSLFTKSAAGTMQVDSDESEWMQTAYDIAEEGMVLLENNDGALPLDSTDKVNLLGYAAYNPVYSGSGSGSVSAADSISILDSLESAGIKVNSACVDEGVYDLEETKDKSVGFMSAAFSLDEVALSKYTGKASFDNMKEYSDIAIVVLGRTGGEGNDLTSYEGGDYLELSDNERDLLEKSCDTFGKVIVVFNTANAIQLDFLNDYDVDACIWAGVPGPYGFEALGKIITGEVNPSGRITDTWVYDHDSNPTSENFSDQEASNMAGRYYVDYVEGIYVGYKWYETAYTEGAVITNTKSGETFDYNDYESIVRYPFGSGLSYTTFTQEIVGGTAAGENLDPTGSFEIKVKVTNTGDAAGKEAVQLYVTAPYTDYDIENGVEKAAVSLCGIGKTDILEPGESEIINITVAAEDIASYDSTYANSDGSYGSYMLDAGEYVFSVRQDAHTSIAEISCVVDGQYFYSGDNKRSSDEVVAENQFEEAARGEYLSRNNAFENYASAMASVSTELKSTEYASEIDVYDEELDKISEIRHYEEGVDYAVGGDLTLEDMAGVDYDDEKWNEFIAQLTLDECTDLVVDSMFGTSAVSSIDKQRTSESDGPLGISSMMNSALSSVAYPSVPLLAATFNQELAYRYGEMVADQGHNVGVSGWYAPAMNIHRSAYSGRNYEYYSEDGCLSGLMAASEVKGARDKGMIVYLKHFALNDMETNRKQIHVYSNEQAIREIYLKPFEEAVKLGGASGIMNSMNYVGDVYAGGHVGLINNVLRGEWGFRGSVLTDMDEGGEIRSINACLRAGTDKWLSFGTMEYPSTSTDADIYYLQRAAKNILYTDANAVTIGVEVINWRIYLYILNAELIAMIVSSIAAIIICQMKKKSEQNINLLTSDRSSTSIS